MNRFSFKIFSLLFSLALLICSVCGCTQSQSNAKQTAEIPENGYSLSQLPAYSGAPYVALHLNNPAFTEAEITATAFEHYSELDSLGRCGEAMACIGTELMPTEERGQIGMIKPSGWKTVKYDCVDGKYLYNRCHLIGYQLSGENANEKNLITGTRYLNTEGMLPFENTVAEYVKSTGNHVLYRVVPIFEGLNLVASGVTLEAYSVEDGGAGVKFYVYCYNVQPEVEINYQTGDSRALTPSSSSKSSTLSSSEISASGAAFILNTSSKKIHRPNCDALKDTKPQNKKSVTKSCAELIKEGYSPCKLCKPEK